MDATSPAAKIADGNKNMINCKVLSMENLFGHLIEAGAFNDIRTAFGKGALSFVWK